MYIIYARTSLLRLLSKVPLANAIKETQYTIGRGSLFLDTPISRHLGIVKVKPLTKGE
jgi:hypothetical protein